MMLVALFLWGSLVHASGSDCEARLAAFDVGTAVSRWLGREPAVAERAPEWVAGFRRDLDRYPALRYVTLTAALDVKVFEPVDRAHFEPPSEREVREWKEVVSPDTDENRRIDMLEGNEHTTVARVVNARQTVLTYLALFYPGAMSVNEGAELLRSRFDLVTGVEDESSLAGDLDFAQTLDKLFAEEASSDGRARLRSWLEQVAVLFPQVIESEAKAMQYYEIDRLLTDPVVIPGFR